MYLYIAKYSYLKARHKKASANALNQVAVIGDSFWTYMNET